MPGQADRCFVIKLVKFTFLVKITFSVKFKWKPAYFFHLRSRPLTPFVGLGPMRISSASLVREIRLMERYPQCSHESAPLVRYIQGCPVLGQIKAKDEKPSFVWTKTGWDHFLVLCDFCTLTIFSDYKTRGSGCLDYLVTKTEYSTRYT